MRMRILNHSETFHSPETVDIAKNHREMKLRLKWHNLSLLYIWNGDQIYSKS